MSPSASSPFRCMCAATSGALSAARSGDFELHRPGLGRRHEAGMATVGGHLGHTSPFRSGRGQPDGGFLTGDALRFLARLEVRALARALVGSLWPRFVVPVVTQTPAPGSRNHRHCRPRPVRHRKYPPPAWRAADTGLQTASEKAVGLDMRPATGQLFLVHAARGRRRERDESQLLRRPCDGGRHVDAASRAPWAPPTSTPGSTTTRSSTAFAWFAEQQGATGSTRITDRWRATTRT